MYSLRDTYWYGVKHTLPNDKSKSVQTQNTQLEPNQSVDAVIFQGPVDVQLGISILLFATSAKMKNSFEITTAKFLVPSTNKRCSCFAKWQNSCVRTSYSREIIIKNL